MSQQMVTLSLVTKSDLAWGAAYDILSKVVLDHGEQFDYTNLSTVDMDDRTEEDEPEVYYDDLTLVKVQNALRSVWAGGTHECPLPLNDNEVNDIINALHNAGIVFREIAQ